MPVSTSEQDSLNRKPLGGEHATGQGEEGLHIGEPRFSAANKDRPKEPVHFGARTECDPPVSGSRHPQSPPSRTEPAGEANESAQTGTAIAGFWDRGPISDADCGPDASSPATIARNGAELAPDGDAAPAITEKPAGLEKPAAVAIVAAPARIEQAEQAFVDACNGLDASRPPTNGGTGAEVAPDGDAAPAVTEKPAGFKEPAVVVNDAAAARPARSGGPFVDARHELETSRPTTKGGAGADSAPDISETRGERAARPTEYKRLP